MILKNIINNKYNEWKLMFWIFIRSEKLLKCAFVYVCNDLWENSKSNFAPKKKQRNQKSFTRKLKLPFTFYI